MYTKWTTEKKNQITNFPWQKVNRSHIRSISQCREIIYNVMKVFSCNDFDREACRFHVLKFVFTCKLHVFKDILKIKNLLFQFISNVHVTFNVFYIISAPHPLSFKITWFSRTYSIQLHDTLIRSVFKH